MEFLHDKWCKHLLFLSVARDTPIPYRFAYKSIAYKIRTSSSFAICSHAIARPQGNGSVGSPKQTRKNWGKKTEGRYTRTEWKTTTVSWNVLGMTTRRNIEDKEWRQSKFTSRRIYDAAMQKKILQRRNRTCKMQIKKMKRKRKNNVRRNSRKMRRVGER